MSLTLCMDSQHIPHVPSAQINSDSYQIAIDSCCLFLITKHRRDFIGELMPCNMKIQGFTRKKGNWRFGLEDDEASR